ncbi:MAG TPA: sulfotransferase [Sandaracinaceae bacterium LLY-WYZ-13_1]|nr:sulfotransferase [Sandaracinaceae bacterium LLY-WYZ-13_1]
MKDRLLFLISTPRSGSTLMQRMIGSHSEVFTHPEPHLMTPLAHLGYYDTVDKAPYDHVNGAEAIRLFVRDLPHGEEDYLDALRCYADTLYGRMLEPTGKRYFLDKTPAYALVLDFLARVYPEARYVVLTRHPLAIFSSYANSFFDGDWHAAHAYNPILERYVPAIARFVRERPAPLTHVRYEEVVQNPEAHLERVFAFLGLENEPEAVNYGARFRAKKGPGDPIAVDQHARPVADSLHKWAAELKAEPRKLELARRMIDRLAPDDLEVWGWPRARIFDALEQVGGVAPPQPVLNAYTLQRKVMLALKKDIHERPHGKLIQKLRYYCDVLLRE